MTQEQIIEGNKLIGKFDGLILRKANQSYNIGQWWIRDENKKLKFVCYDGRLKYHESWDWLIPAIKKASNLTIKDGILVNYSVATFVTKLGVVKRHLIKMT